jgi:hypothetical protein
VASVLLSRHAADVPGRISRAVRHRAVTVCHETAAGRASQVSSGSCRGRTGAAGRERHSVIRLQSPSSSPGSPAAAQVRALCACHEPTLIAAARSQVTASSPRGTFSQAELTGDWVITRCITRPVPVPGAAIRNMAGDLQRLPAPDEGPAAVAAELLGRVRAARTRHTARGGGTLPQICRHPADGGVMGGSQASGHAARIWSMPSIRREAGRSAPDDTASDRLGCVIICLRP